MTERQRLLDEVSQQLGPRRLVFFGTRAEDAEALSNLPQYDAAFSLIGAVTRRPSVESLSLEELTGRRVDLDAYEVDDHLRSDGVGALRDAMLRALARPSALFTYRPTTLSSAVGFARRDRCLSLEMFKGLQSAFEHKPWLESEVVQAGIPAIPWRYVPDRERHVASSMLGDGPIMLRRSRTSGGTGLFQVMEESELEGSWPEEDEAFVSVAPFIEGGVPLNIGAVAWDDGVTVHRASVQLIGIEGLTTRPFGFCGNDFSAVETLDPDVLPEVEVSTLRIGDLLRRLGYRGAFGVDFLITEGGPLFTEVNPRFQGSTHASCRLSVSRDEPCILLDHLAAHLGLPCPTRPPLVALHRDVQLSHLVVHNTGSRARFDVDAAVDPFRRAATFAAADVLVPAGTEVDHGGTVARVTMNEQVTSNGFELWSGCRSIVEQVSAPLPSATAGETHSAERG